jgi:hypothetical protein
MDIDSKTQQQQQQQQQQQWGSKVAGASELGVDGGRAALLGPGVAAAAAAEVGAGGILQQQGDGLGSCSLVEQLQAALLACGGDGITAASLQPTPAATAVNTELSVPATAPGSLDAAAEALFAAEDSSSIKFTSMTDLQQQVEGCEVGMQLLWDVAQASHGADVNGAELDAADLLLRCTDADTLQACQQQCLEASSDDDAGQAQFEQTLEIVSGLLQLLHQPAVVQLLGEVQHRQRLQDVSEVYHALHAAGADASGRDLPGSSAAFDAPSAAPMACSTLG